MERCSGILLHPTSLPGPHGIGDLGEEAHRLVDAIADAGCRLWQVLPLGPTGLGDSPYQSLSSFAGNPALIALAPLVEEGLLDPKDAEPPAFDPRRVDNTAACAWKERALALAFERFDKGGKADLAAEHGAFETWAASWLPEFALFVALKGAHEGAAWTAWPEPLRLRRPEALASARTRLAREIRKAVFAQFVFFRQWVRLRKRAAARMVRIVGDLPIFTALDSADVWASPELFHLDTHGHPTVVAGVPPDYFSRTGQLWGNPLYRWEAHAEDGFQWWIGRLRAATALVDRVRLDHFRGLCAYWEVPRGSATAASGRWIPGPGAALLTALESALGALPLLAEDLGDISEDVHALREQFSLPGMKVLQFAFTGQNNAFLPHRYAPNCVVYTGTHDNDTTPGWWRTASPEVRAFAKRYLRSDGSDIAGDLIRAAWSSVASYAIVPMQDLLRLGSEARMNNPGTTRGNWSWRAPAGTPGARVLGELRELNTLYGRNA